MNKFLLLGVLFCCKLSNAQNMIPNPSFEDTLTRTTQLYLPAKWVSPTTGSPDYFIPLNENFKSGHLNFIGYQTPNLGEAYMGLSIYSLYANNASKRFREYIQNELSDTLKKDSIYCLQLYISLANSSRYGSKGILGVHFSETAISSNNFYYLPFIPQIIVSPDSFITEKEEWLELNFKYQATGGEKYISIGNFNDSNIVDTVFVGGGRKSEIDHVGTYYYIDDIFLGHCDSLPEDTSIGLRENSLENQFSIYPNPFENRVVVRYNGNEKLQFQLYNLFGQSVETASYLAVTSKNYELSLGICQKDCTS